MGEDIRRRYLAHATTILGVGLIVCSILLLISIVNYNQLNSKYEALSRSYSELYSEYTSLEADYRELRSSYRNLQNEYDQLKSSYNLLSSDYSNLKTNYEALQSNYRSLQSSYSAVLDDRQTLLSELEHLNETYRSLFDAISIRSPYGEQCCRFITIDDPQLRSVVRSITGGWGGSDNDLWNDLEKLQGWVVQNIKYSYDTYSPSLSLGARYIYLSSGMYTVNYVGFFSLGGSYWVEDFWRFPNETLADKHGDCEDQAILLTSMIRCYFKYCVGTLYGAYAMCIGGPSETVGHMAVVIPVAGEK